MSDTFYENIRRFTQQPTNNYHSHFTQSYLEPTTPNIWSQTSLKPSQSIWGFSLPPKNNDLKAEVKEKWEPTLPTAVPLQFQSTSPRPSITSLSSASSSPLWGEDSMLFSPPLSPQLHQKQQDCNTVPPLSGGLDRPIEEDMKGANSGEKLVISCACGPLYVVQFKGTRRDIFTAPGTTSYQIGDAVMVDADRGKDLGVITQVNISRHEAAALKQQQHNDRQQVLHSTNAPIPANEGPSIYTPKQILSSASLNEIRDLTSKVEDEKSAILLCNKKVQERNLDMEIVDAEYQWDRRKLTFFYTANSRVDFRDLVRELFRIYKTRIWMCATTARN